MKLFREGKKWHRYLDKLIPMGYVILSACRGEKSDSQNRQDTNGLRMALKKSKFAFTPVEGGYVYQSGEENARGGEASFLVANYDKRKHMPNENFQELQDLAIALCGNYDESSEYYPWRQESILIARPKEKPYYLYTEDKTADAPFNKVSFNDFEAKFYTGDKKGKMIPDPIEKGKSSSVNDDGSLSPVKRNFTLFSGKRPPHASDPSDVYSVDYSDEEKKEAEKMGISLDDKNSYLKGNFLQRRRENAKKNPHGKKRMHEAVFVASQGDVNIGFHALDEDTFEEKYARINQWLSKKMGILPKEANTFRESLFSNIYTNSLQNGED